MTTTRTAVPPLKTLALALAALVTLLALTLAPEPCGGCFSPLLAPEPCGGCL